MKSVPIKTKKYPSFFGCWDQFYMTMAHLVAMKSKDPNTKVGSVIVGRRNNFVSLGFNGLPRGVKDDLPERSERPEKYFWYAHAERNSIYNAAKDLEGCRLYTQFPPCTDCAIAIIQSGISEVIVMKSTHHSKKWEVCSRSLQMFKEAGVKYRLYDPKKSGPIIKEIVRICDGIEEEI